MKPEQIHLGDWHRLLLGDAPWRFLPEVMVRTLLIYLTLLVTMRVFGKRMTGQMTILEMGVMLLLGAIVSVPMQVPERGLVIGAVLLVCILLLQRGLGRLGFASRSFELLSQGDAIRLVKDGVLELDVMRASALSRQQVYAVLREKEIRQLGAVRRLYLEACGEFSLFEHDRPRPGLCILPAKDPAAGRRCAPAPGHVACARCGLVQPRGGRPPRCPSCGHDGWAPAVT